MGNNIIPNIAPNGYPNVNNVNVFNTQTTFNYSLWAPNSTLILTNVPWDNNYKDVVKFENDEARDNWFTSQLSKSSKINNAVRIPHENYVSLPFNFDEIINYNYLIAEYPLPNGVNGNNPRTKYFYFINDIAYKNANVTDVIIELDVWTTFINDINIGQSFLERGHAPMTISDVDTYLSDPINNCEGLLSDDVNFGEATNVKNEHFVSFKSGEQYVLIATSSNIDGEWDDNVTCNDTNVTDGLPTNISLFAIKSSNFNDFISYINNNIPQFMQTIQAIFVLDESFITLGDTFNIGEIVCYYVNQAKTNLYDIILNKEMFNYPEEYQWITKLYTSPYSEIEITDNNGKTVIINIEDISSSASIKSISSTAFPFINIRAFITGVGGSGSNSYTIKKFDEDEIIDMYFDNWQQYSWDINIPIYGIFQKNSITYNYSTKFDRIQKQNDIDISNTNTNESALVNKNNSNDDVYNNFNNTALMLNQNKQFNIDDNNLSENIMNNNLETSINLANMNQVLRNYKYNCNVQQNYISSELKQNTAFMNTATSMTSAALSTINAASLASMATGGIGIAPAVTGGLLNLGASLSNGIYASDQADNMYDIFWEQNKLLYAYEGTLDIAMNGSSGQKYTITNPKDNSVYNWGTDDGEPTEGLIHENERINFNNTKSNSLTHNDTNFNNNTTINTNNKNTSLSNIDRSYNQNIENSNRVKSNSEQSIQNMINQAALRNNNQYSSYSGNAKLDSEGLRGLDIKIKTQSKDAISKTANYFLRYGYSFNNNYEVSNFNIMKYFTYWKFSEIWLKNNNVINNAIIKLKEILEFGVTVWRNPDDIGFISPTENTIL